ncbi:hypothetical protein QJS04_geneDACA006519 [Acorus gramineus]|uniref:Uncharacterized protein n=1 Tax=Acorus gramineus TaxID=55184 RepID=A0AAV9AW51_ACOGR|nr:hypothetical protein QJS04_geneDACA006519 [Acorus gramineus]
MALAFTTRLSCLLLGGRGRGRGRGRATKEEHEPSAAPSNPQMNPATSDVGLGFRDPDAVRFRGVSSPRRVRRKWQSREERKRIDREYDMVIVPSDGDCLSGSESDDSDWSIGWLEPHSSDLMGDDDSDSEGSFAVLVPCYRRGRNERAESPIDRVLGAINGFTNGMISSENDNYMEQWLASLRNS